jgi:hypothetical protein
VLEPGIFAKVATLVAGIEAGLYTLNAVDLHKLNAVAP